MDSSAKMPAQTSLFQVYLRLRPPIQAAKDKTDSWLIVEPPPSPTDTRDDLICSFPKHITLQPPNDSRKRAIERFGFTKIFQEHATQLEVFEETGTAETIKTVLQSGRDGLVATLGVTGSGKVDRQQRLFDLNKLTDSRIESYNPGIQVTEGTYPNDIGCSFSIDWRQDQTT